MSDLERLLGDAFDARARAAVPDHAAPPPPRFAQTDAVPVLRKHRRRLIAPLSAAAAVVLAVGLGVGLSRADHDAHTTGGTDTGAGPQLTAPADAVRATAGAQPVKIALRNEDGQTYGVGMPVIAYFSRTVTDARSFQKATTVTVDGAPVNAAWYFEPSSAGRGPLEAHLRTQTYWPAHAAVHVAIAARGITAGTGLGFSNDLTLDFRTGPRIEVRVDPADNRLTAYRDGSEVFHCQVALGAKATPTLTGTKVIMDKREQTTLTEGGRSRTSVRYVQRLTYGGEYLLAAPWLNPAELGSPRTANVSGGSTDMLPASAQKLFALTRIGDVVTYLPAAHAGPQMQLGAGYGDWNVSWGLWQRGGAAPTR